MIESLRRFSPNFSFHVFLSDLTRGMADNIRNICPNIQFQFIEEFGDESVLANSLRMTEIEFNTSLKAVAVCWLFEAGYKSIIFCDSDLYFLNSPILAIEALQSNNVVLTPHQNSPSSARADLQMCRYGVFNAGFFGFAGEGGRQAAKWFRSRTTDYCIQEPSDGLFVDQKWLDLMPALFSGVHVIRESSYNVAYWNIEARPEEQNTTFLHLSGINLANHFSSGMQLSKYSDVLIDDEMANILNSYLNLYYKMVNKTNKITEKAFASDIFICFQDYKSPSMRRFLHTKYSCVYEDGRFVMKKRNKTEAVNRIPFYHTHSSAFHLTRSFGMVLCWLGAGAVLDRLIHLFTVLGRRNNWIS